MTQDIENAFGDREGMGLALAFEQFAAVVASVTTNRESSGCLSLFCDPSSIVRSGELPHRFYHVTLNMTLLYRIEVASRFTFFKMKKLLENSVILNLIWNLTNVCFIVLLIKSLTIYYVKKNRYK